MIEGIELVRAVALPLCQSPLCWRDLGTNLVGLLWLWVEAGEVAPAVESSPSA